MTINWMNPTNDVQEARRIGYEEGYDSRDEEVCDLEGQVEELVAIVDPLIALLEQRLQVAFYSPNASCMGDREDTKAEVTVLWRWAEGFHTRRFTGDSLAECLAEAQAAAKAAEEKR